jgi:hypothetical protein
MNEEGYALGESPPISMIQTEDTMATSSSIAHLRHESLGEAAKLLDTKNEPTRKELAALLVNSAEQIRLLKHEIKRLEERVDRLTALVTLLM